MMNHLYLIVLTFLHLSFEISCTSDNYRIYNLYQEGICRAPRLPLFDKVLARDDPIQLRDPNKGYIFRQSWNSSSFKRISYCRFYLQAPEGMGLYILVRETQLRKNVNGQCIDTIEAKFNGRKYQFCDSFEDENFPKGFRTDEAVRITINLDKMKPLDHVEDELSVELVVTIWKECGPKKLIPCSESCISSQFQNDGIINCPTCTDEMGCRREQKEVEMINPTNVIFSAVVSLLVTMFGFGGLLWCLFKHRRRIVGCSSSSSGNDERNQSSSRGDVTLPDLNFSAQSTTGGNDLAAPSAPEEMDDLPPSYETLFNPVEKERIT
ncbi:uncharacterized protein LOC129739204 [Uranotaenia lowii]|uniref:uncharacterized protein LOC129739204 n=1 Tax=Uranotaenia lowii TaxID=190385 RepID=UPI002479056E|nr:uncharacterized protein LOC129739204 [Uranotaenia lowii]